MSSEKTAELAELDEICALGPAMACFIDGELETR
jgi:hypothetical protein